MHDNIFLQTGIISDSDDSLFTYEDGESFDTFYNEDFVPEFEPVFSSPALEEQANSICGSDPFCRFDIAATGRTDIGLTTLQGNIEFETIVNISQPGIQHFYYDYDRASQQINPCEFSEQSNIYKTCTHIQNSIFLTVGLI